MGYYSSSMRGTSSNKINWYFNCLLFFDFPVFYNYLGDPDYKGFQPGAVVDAFFLWPDDHNKVFHGDLVLSEPECQLHTITYEDDFLIFASDGLWDVVSPAEAVKHVQ